MSQKFADFYQPYLMPGRRPKASGWVEAGLCPFHRDTNSGSFFVNLTTGAFKCHSCGASGASAVRFATLLGITAIPPRLTANHAGNSGSSQVNYLKRKQIIENTLVNCFPISDSRSSIARAYLQNRGIPEILQDIPPDLMFHPRTPYYVNGEKIAEYPALICIIRDHQRSIISLHRTYLSIDGTKAQVRDVKKVLPPTRQEGLKGCAAQLYPCEGSLAVTEGIETALAVRVMTGLPVWATTSAPSLATLVLPPTLERLYILADHDRNMAGPNAAATLRDRYHDRIKIKILVPSLPPSIEKWDWLDYKISKS